MTPHARSTVRIGATLAIIWLGCENTPMTKPIPGPTYPPPATQAGGAGGAAMGGAGGTTAPRDAAAIDGNSAPRDGGSGDARSDSSSDGAANTPEAAPPSGDAGASANRPAGTNLTFHVSPTGDDGNNGLTADSPLRTLNLAFKWAEPGDTVQLAPGTHIVQSDFGNGGDVVSWRSGRPDAPITIKGPPEAIVKSRIESNRDRIFYIVHDHIVFDGFTIDGLRGDDATNCMRYVDTLVFAHGGMVKDPMTGRSEAKAPRKPITGIKLLRMTLRNSGGECVRFRYFAQKNEVAFSKIARCGAKDFLAGSKCKTGVNGEGIYVGTSSNQWADATKNASNEPDQSNENWFHDNELDTKANECIEIKEGATKNLVEKNKCTGQLDPNSGGLGSRGSGNIFRGNDSSGNKGAGIRIGGHDDWGTGNEVTSNTFRDNAGGAIKIMIDGSQGPICGNSITGSVGRVPGGLNPTRACN